MTVQMYLFTHMNAVFPSNLNLVCENVGHKVFSLPLFDEGFSSEYDRMDSS